MFTREYRLDLVDSRSGRTLASYDGKDAAAADRRATYLSLDRGGRVEVHPVVDDRRYDLSGGGRIKEGNQQI